MFFVFEGPDGGGKTSAFIRVAQRFPQIEQMPRFATSGEGPKPNLDALVDKDAGPGWTMQAEHLYGLYDRHPLISELIYGPIIRNRLPGRFNDPTWLRMRVRELANRSVLVWCIPPLPNVQAELDVVGRVDMPGVDVHLEALYSAYVAMRAVWPGHRAYTHDYTTDPDGHRLLEMIRAHCRGD